MNYFPNIKKRNDGFIRIGDWSCIVPACSWWYVGSVRKMGRIRELRPAYPSPFNRIEVYFWIRSCLFGFEIVDCDLVLDDWVDIPEMDG